MGSPRKNNFPRPLFVLKTASGSLLLVEQKTKGKGRKAVAANVTHYVLKKEVTIPARPFVGFSAATLQKMTNLLLQNFQARLIAAMEGRRQAHYAENPLIT